MEKQMVQTRHLKLLVSCRSAVSTVLHNALAGCKGSHFR